MDDRELVRKILQGDEQAKTQFYLQHKERLYKDSVYLLGYRDPEAEDLVQETFMIAFKKLPEFEFRSALGTWLMQICIFLCYNRYRNREKTVAREEEELENLLRPKSLEEAERNSREDDKTMKLWLIDQALGKIGPECREVVILRDKEGKTYIEIGKLLRIPLGTVMSRLSRCKKALKVLIEHMIREG